MEGRLDTHLKLDEARDKIQTLGEKLAEEVSSNSLISSEIRSAANGLRSAVRFRVSGLG